MTPDGTDPRRRRGRTAHAVPRESPPPAPSVTERPREKVAPPPAPPTTPFLLDFFPLEETRFTRLTPFYDALRKGRLTTTRCRRDGELFWPPRTVCPRCHTEELDWVDLPKRGHLYAFSAVLAGAPLGMEADVPFVVGLVDLDGAPLRLFGRVAGTTWELCRIGQPVEVEPFELGDGRVFYRFRALDAGRTPEARS